MIDIEAVVQRYYGDRPVLQRIGDALRSAGVDPQRPSHRDLWPFDQLHSRGIVATREHAERASIQAGMYVLDLGCGLGGASRYLAAECSCRVAAIDLTPNFVEAARVLTARCRLAERIEFRQANALALPFDDGTFDHVWSYAVTMNVADKEGLGHEVARVLKPGGRFSCNEIARGSGEDPIFPLPWASDAETSFLSTPAEMCAALEAGGLSVLEQIDVTATRLGETGRQPVIEHDDFPLRQHNLQSCLADGRLIAQFILAEKRRSCGAHQAFGNLALPAPSPEAPPPALLDRQTGTSAMLFPVTDHVIRTARHASFYLASGPEAGPLIIFVHGWPELSHSWRHQLRCFAALGFRCVAPDMRGYGRSSHYDTHADYALEHSVDDMLELLAHLGRERAVWVGHDWGSPVVWSLASHHPECCEAIANLCVPYIAYGFATGNLIALVSRNIYPEATYPAGQWEYQLFYEAHFDRARSAFEADIENTIRALFRKGNPAGRGKPSRTAEVRRDNGWFGGAGKAPAVPLDPTVISEEDLSIYAAALARSGFFGPDSWYMNSAANVAYAARARDAGKLTLPVLFLHGAYDYTCETIDSRLAEPMRRNCADLTEVIVFSGHWMAQERPIEVNAALAKWLAVKAPDAWPTPDTLGRV